MGRTVGKKKTDTGGQHPDNDRQKYSIHQCLVGLAHGENISVGGKADMPVQINKTLFDNFQQRPDDKNKKSQDHPHRYRSNNRIAECIPGYFNLI